MIDNMDLVKAANIHAAISDKETAHLVIGLNKVVSSQLVEGLFVDAREGADGVVVAVRVAEGARLSKPVHMCFGLLQEAGVQKIDMEVDVGAGAHMEVVAHCVFPNAREVRHLMDARIRIGEGAHYRYFERHIHSPAGGIIVEPKARIELGDNGRFRTDFELIEGRVGRIEIDYETVCGAGAILEMNARVSGKGDDVIVIRETGHLAGVGSTGVLTSRVAVRDDAVAEVYNKLTASAAMARGHVDCKEIIQGNARASAVPIVEVSHPKAHVTHEASLGSVDHKQLETLMSRGLDEDAASDLIIAGLLA